MSGREQFKAPSVQDITGTEDFLPNLAVGMATDPLTYAGLGSSWSTGAKALKSAASPLAEAGAGVLGKVTEAAPNLIEQVGKEIPSTLKGMPTPIPEAKRVVPAFYSRLEEGIAKLPESIKSESVINQLKKMGVTNEEIEATNLAKALEGKPRVSKQELMNHFGEKKVQVEEVMKGDPKFAGADENALTKFPDYQTPGGENYRELLLKTPQKEFPEGLAIKRVDNPHAKGGTSYQVVDANGKPMFQDAMYPTHEQAAQKANDYMSTFENQNFQGSHWEEPNVLSHVRFNDRVGPNGEKILHIEEIQSDWHQEGRKRGYVGDKKPEIKIPAPTEVNYTRENGEWWAGDQGPLRGVGDTKEAAYEDMAEQFRRLHGDKPQTPSGPFKDTWHELSMKRMIRYAAENNYDEITLNSGEQINKVLGGGSESLAGQKKFYDEQLPNWMKKYATKHGVKIDKTVILDDGYPVHKGFVSRMPINSSMREQALTRGLPLMQMGAGAGGSALLAALLSQENS